MWINYLYSSFFRLGFLLSPINRFYLFPASVLAAIPVVLFFFPLPTHILVLVCSLLVGAGWITGGIICYFLEKKTCLSIIILLEKWGAWVITHWVKVDIISLVITGALTTAVTFFAQSAVVKGLGIVAGIGILSKYAA
jgi:hypothetical protein